MYKYEEISRDIESLVRSGTLQAGEKIPSVRSISSQYQVSIATVLTAYTDLEKKGFIESRERSGYFARMPATQRTTLPQTPVREIVSGEVVSTRLIRQFCESSQDLHPPQFGAAIPSPDLLPVAALKKKIIQVSRTNSFGLDSYDFSQGPLILRREIAKLYFKRGVTVDPDDIIITNGCVDAIILALKSVVAVGSTVIVETPTYFGFLELLKFHGYKVCEIPTSAESGINVDCLDKSIRKCGVRGAILIPSFHNPTGACVSEDNRQAIVDIFSKHAIPVIEDDVYGELAFTRKNPAPLKRFDTTGIVITCSSFSKTLSPGLRVGWCISERFRDQIQESKGIHMTSSSTINVHAVADYLVEENYDRHMYKLKRAFEYQVEAVSATIHACFPENTRISNPSGGFFLWIELPDQVDTGQLFRSLLPNGISIAPGSIFCTQGGYRNFMRLSCGFPHTTESERALWRIGEEIRRLV